MEDRQQGARQACAAVRIRLTSQEWQGIKWEHWLSVLIPAEVDTRSRAVLAIGGGSNRDEPVKSNSREAMLMATMASQARLPLVILEQVPNQPLFGDLKEDDLIAHTFDKFLKGEGDDWPLLLPMVKSAVRAMDAIQQAGPDLNLDIKEFVVTGASKRGWTTWLTGASDPRAIGIAPMVIDVLNMGEQMHRQLATYGKFSRMIEPYTKRGVQERMHSPSGKVLREIVDPFNYIGRIDQPKLIFLGSNDPYWTADAASLYYGDLVGDKAICYVPNAGHGLGPQAISPAVAFFRSIALDKPLPKISWERPAPGEVTVKWEAEGAKATVWQATSPNRDFREANWVQTELVGTNKATAKVAPPADGSYVGFYAQVDFPGNPADPKAPPFFLCTDLRILPDTFPHEDLVKALHEKYKAESNASE
ncbi:MAG: PhoPQ-activated protein PqaA family protein [Verrucomicrobiales bacterium]